MPPDTGDSENKFVRTICQEKTRIISCPPQTPEYPKGVLYMTNPAGARKKGRQSADILAKKCKSVVLSLFSSCLRPPKEATGGWGTNLHTSKASHTRKSSCNPWIDDALFGQNDRRVSRLLRRRVPGTEKLCWKASTPCRSAISSGCESHPANWSLGRKQPERRKEVTPCVEVLCVKVTLGDRALRRQAGRLFAITVGTVQSRFERTFSIWIFPLVGGLDLNTDRGFRRQILAGYTMYATTLFLVGSLLFGCITLAIGVMAGLWISALNCPTPRASQPDISGDGCEGLARERVLTFSSSVIRLVQNVSSDLRAHSTKIQAISAGLREVDHSLPQTRHLIETAPDRILAANAELQEQLARANQQIEVLAAQLRARESEARTDIVTTLFNRRAFEEELRKQLSLWDRTDTPFALLMLDIDHFKRLNDGHGHQLGDVVLREVGQLIVEQLRDMDFAFRYGGEEYAVILPSTKSSDACLAAERIRKTIEQSVIPCADKRLHVTVSVGVAHVIAADRPLGLIGRADDGLYRAKQSGRNCVCWHNGGDIVLLKTGEAPASAPTYKPGTMRQFKPTPIKTLNSELTRHVCDSRHSQIPLSLVCMRIVSCPITGNDFIKESADRLLPVLHTLICPKLKKNDLFAPMSAAEFILVLPGCLHDAAIQLVEGFLETREVGTLKRKHGVLLQYVACELLPNETAEQLLLRARECTLVSSAS